MDAENERLRILDQIDSGEITATEGLRLLQSIGAVGVESGSPSPQDAAGVETDTSAPADSPAGDPQQNDAPEPEVLVGEPLTDTSSIPLGAEKWKNWWMVLVWVGTGIAVLGSLLMYTAFISNGVGFWFLFSVLPFALGILLMIIGVQSRTAKWLHLRIQQKPGESPQRIAISFPLPIHLSAWFFRTFGRYIPNLDGVAVDQIILALDQTTSPGNPIYISVDEGDRGNKVDIFIG